MSSTPVPVSSPVPVLVIGAGISGIACARALRDRGADVRVVDRARVVGGRMASRRIGGRPVDLGASYFTSDPDAPFHAVVREWEQRGLAREWTDTFAVATPDGITDRASGPMRYAAPGGLRSLVADLARDVEVDLETPIKSVRESEATVLAMPDPQARRLLSSPAVRERLSEAEQWQPTLAVAIRYGSRHWADDLHGAFVNESPDLTFIADDGDRRGDGAPVLVAHSTPDLARAYLDDPDAAAPAIVAAVARVLGIGTEPESVRVHRWSFAKPAALHDEPYLLDASGPLGVCGDGWGGRSSVSAAWTSGDAVGRAFPLEEFE